METGNKKTFPGGKVVIVVCHSEERSDEESFIIKILRFAQDDRACANP
jgi:hypothetical protein